MNRMFIALLAIGGGLLLAGMISLNSELANFTSPIVASWIAHGIGAVIALLLLLIIRLYQKPHEATPGRKAPWWAYCGGVPGAMIVAVSAVTVNSEVGLTGTLALGIVGQTIFGMVCDQFGWFGLNKRPLNLKDYLTVAFILTGSILVISA